MNSSEMKCFTNYKQCHMHAQPCEQQCIPKGYRAIERLLEQIESLLDNNGLSCFYRAVVDFGSWKSRARCAGRATLQQWMRCTTRHRKGERCETHNVALCEDEASISDSYGFVSESLDFVIRSGHISIELNYAAAHVAAGDSCGIVAVSQAGLCSIYRDFYKWNEFILPGREA